MEKVNKRNLWVVSVHKLILIFKDSLGSIMPYFEMAKIPWEADNAYDEWDDVAASLFNALVISNIKFSQEFHEEVKVPKYGFDPNFLIDTTFLVAKTANDPDKIFFLKNLMIENDSVECMIYEKDLTHGIKHRLAFSEVKFYLMDENKKLYDKITVKLD